MAVIKRFPSPAGCLLLLKGDIYYEEDVGSVPLWGLIVGGKTMAAITFPSPVGSFILYHIYAALSRLLSLFLQ
ncbi:MAG: hypothetical protein IJ874_00040 [Ruminococcus sp.]|nr:hypothetical protein [Ruminococcus sp.]